MLMIEPGKPTGRTHSRITPVVCIKFGDYVLDTLKPIAPGGITEAGT